MSGRFRGAGVLILCFFSGIAKAQSVVKAHINNSDINAVYTFDLVNKVYISVTDCECRELDIKSKDFIITKDSTKACLFELVSKLNQIKEYTLEVFCKESLIGKFNVVALNPPTPIVNVYGRMSNLRAAIPIHFDSIEVHSPFASYTREKYPEYTVNSYDIEFYDSVGLVRYSKGTGKYIPLEDAAYFKKNIYTRGFYAKVKNIKITLTDGREVIHYTEPYFLVGRKSDVKAQ